MARLGERRWVKGMQEVRNYQDYLAEYNKRIAPQREKRLKVALQAKAERKRKGIDISEEYLVNPWLKPIELIKETE